MVHFMAFSCKTGSIDRCLGLDVSAPSPGGLAGLLARLSHRLRIISPRMYLTFIFLPLICSLSALWLPVLWCALYHRLTWTFGCGGGEEDRAGQRRSTQWCRSLNLQDLIARLHAETTSTHQHTGSHLSHTFLPTQWMKDRADAELVNKILFDGLV